MGLKIYINGKFYPESRAKVSVFDHGYLYGDGVFETLRSEGGEVFKLDEHLNRLFNSAQTIKLRVPLTKEEIKEAVKETLKKNRLKSAYIRVSLSRGRGELGLSPKSCSSPNLVIIAKGPKGYPLKLYQKGVEVITVSTRRSDPAMLFPNIKCANFLWGILAKIEAEQRDAFEAILLNSKGEVTEGTVSNIFIVKESILITPPTYVGILEGITRNCVIEARRQVMELVKFLRKKVPGFENSYLLITAPQIGIRETRRIIGEYILSEADLLQARKPSDAIALGSYGLDIHNPKGEGTIIKKLKKGAYYGIPYRCLIPKKIEGLIIAGRPISATHAAHSSVRIQPICYATGQAAGSAAALALSDKTTPRKVNVEKLQKVLKREGAKLN